MTPQTDASAVLRVELPDGRVLVLQDPEVVGFNLFEAQRHARRGGRTRRQAVADLSRRDDGMWRVSDPTMELNLVSDLAAAVLFSYSALEALGNDTIERLKPGASVHVERDGKRFEVSRDQMEGMLSVPEKLSVVVPAFTGKPSIRGTALWRKLMRICRLREGLALPIDRAPGDPGIFGPLIRGDADRCADDAIAAVRALRPELLPPVLA